MGSHLTSGSSGARHARVPVGPFLGFGEATTTVTVVATVAANGHCNSWLQLDLALSRRNSWNGSRAPCIHLHLERSLAQYSGRRSHQYVLVPLLHHGMENWSWLHDLSWRWDEPSPASTLDPEEGISKHLPMPSPTTGRHFISSPCQLTRPDRNLDATAGGSRQEEHHEDSTRDQTSSLQCSSVRTTRVMHHVVSCPCCHRALDSALALSQSQPLYHNT